MEIKTKQVLRVQNIKSLKGAFGSLAHSYNPFQRSTLTNVEDKFTPFNLVWNEGEIVKANSNAYKKIKMNIDKEMEPYKEEWEERQLKKKPSLRIPFESKIGANNLELESSPKSPVLFQEWVIGIGNIEVYKQLGIVDYEEVEYGTQRGVEKMSNHKITSVINTDQVKKYFDIEMKEFIFNYKKNTGVEPKIIGASLHLDEATPHIHIMTSTLTREFTKTTNSTIYKNKNIINPDTLHKIQETRDHNIGAYLKKEFKKEVVLEERQIKVKYLEKKVYNKLEKAGVLPKDKIHNATKIGYAEILKSSIHYTQIGGNKWDKKETDLNEKISLEQQEKKKAILLASQFRVVNERQEKELISLDNQLYILASNYASKGNDNFKYLSNEEQEKEVLRILKVIQKMSQQELEAYDMEY